MEAKIMVSCPKGMKDYSFYKETVEKAILNYQYEKVISLNNIEIVSLTDGSHSSGLFATKFCKEMMIKLKQFKVDWNDFDPPVYFRQGFYGQYNALAGKNTTTKMAEYVRKSDSGMCIIFNDKSTEIKDVIRQVKIAEIEKAVFDI